MCRDCDTQTYQHIECCASGSCEVCRGVQGTVRAAVYNERHLR